MFLDFLNSSYEQCYTIFFRYFANGNIVFLLKIR